MNECAFPDPAQDSISALIRPKCDRFATHQWTCHHQYNRCSNRSGPSIRRRTEHFPLSPRGRTGTTTFHVKRSAVICPLKSASLTLSLRARLLDRNAALALPPRVRQLRSEKEITAASQPVSVLGSVGCTNCFSGVVKRVSPRQSGGVGHHCT